MLGILPRRHHRRCHGYLTMLTQGVELECPFFTCNWAFYALATPDSPGNKGERRNVMAPAASPNHLKIRYFIWSGRQDSNLRPPHPQCDALPGCATPRPRVGHICG